MQLVENKDYEDEETYAVIGGKKYPVRFAGRDRNTYKHAEGCMARGHENDIKINQPACQCGAFYRTALLFGIYVPPEDAEALQS